MIKSYRTKRRKIQNDLKLLNESKTCFSIQNANQIVVVNTSEINSELDNSTSSTKKHKNQPVYDSYKYNDISVQVNENSNFSKNSEKITDSADCSNTIKNKVEKCSINNEKKPIHIKLKHWALECDVPHSTLDKLLPILKNEEDYKLFQKLPLNSRTLLNSGSSATKNILNIYPGIYYHFGLSYGINRHLLKFKHEDNEIKILVGVDGLPLSKSSSSQFWPIIYNIF
ncbi:Uncharacterized protein FWK35_00021280 [Aphis craccivora]|uniref:Uncharacterized protein n=1 Tax=Aphis craccivora TaxID=307492 RepID=A0A6G0Y277_APHCR|nr:Uncharacterized protein FWK35_00021280 [Aphis craccivora]